MPPIARPLPSGRPIGVGLVGAGRIADVHALAIRAAGGELRGIVSSSPERSAEAAERLSVPNIFRSVAELAADPAIDVVHVTSPTGLHFEHVSAAIDSGVHVVSEKPLATTSADAARLVAGATAAGVVGTVAFSYRFHPVVLEARARVHDGDLGPLLSIRGRYLQDWLLATSGDEWRLDSARGGPSRAWADIGSHLIDLVEFISAEKITRVAATTRRAVKSTSARSNSEDDALAATAETTSGAIGSFLVSQVAPGHANALAVEMSGERGSLTIDLDHTERLRLGTIGSSTDLGGDALARGVLRAGFTPEGGMTDIVAGFCSFVRSSYDLMAGGTNDEVATFADGLRSLHVAEAVLSAAREHQWRGVFAD